jgi:hypothetical protein
MQTEEPIRKSTKKFSSVTVVAHHITQIGQKTSQKDRKRHPPSDKIRRSFNWYGRSETYQGFNAFRLSKIKLMDLNAGEPSHF